MKIRSLIAAGAGCLLFGSAAATAAPTYQFTITGAYSATWQLNATPVPDDFFTSNVFTLWNVAGAFQGATATVTDLTFFNATRGGGMSIYDFNAGVSLLSTDGPQLYSGVEGAPAFLLGTFALTQFQGTDQYLLTVTEVGAIPEPGSMALMLCGLLAVGAARRAGSSATPVAREGV